MLKEITIEGVKYVPAIEETQSEMSVIRTESAGVFYGVVEKVDGDVVTLKNSRRIWVWYGAASLSQLAQEGVKNPSECKIAMVEPVKIVRGWIEITPLTKKAKESLDGVKEWKN